MPRRREQRLRRQLRHERARFAGLEGMRRVSELAERYIAEIEGTNPEPYAIANARDRLRAAVKAVWKQRAAQRSAQATRRAA